MEPLLHTAPPFELFNQLWLTLFLVIPMVLIARTVVAGSCYSPILIIVIFGLALGHVLVATGAAQPGLPGFTLLSLLSGTTVVVLAAAFFAGGQQLRRLFGALQVPPDDSMQPCTEETLLGTNRTQLMFVLRAVFLLLGIEAARRVFMGADSGPLVAYYPLIAYIGVLLAFILIDHKATLRNKREYLGRGMAEIGVLALLLLLAGLLAQTLRPLIALPTGKKGRCQHHHRGAAEQREQ